MKKSLLILFAATVMSCGDNRQDKNVVKPTAQAETADNSYCLVEVPEKDPVLQARGFTRDNPTFVNFCNSTINFGGIRINGYYADDANNRMFGSRVVAFKDATGSDSLIIKRAYPFYVAQKAALGQ